MRAVSVSVLLILVVWVSCFGESGADCCWTKAKLLFTMGKGSCGMVNAKTTKYGCEATVCADGRVLKGSYCGVGSCNIFGCFCRGGCLAGNYGESFVEINNKYQINLISTQMKLANLTDTEA
ncbi:protein Diedel [Drosophila simulans]|uniref:GD17420 n=2 Tax=melanogaster subgroup TaxID=32351 RepID=B4R798_DROSI|nr:protein Diedel [Drosophila simulans]XP_033170621.1 protein Diedel [Drosophila mauritiana]EDX18339.1 GD17420 [Drosophila simulans]KMZ10558.1 uncharacterized protein Dsimw501_GD17420 [Drosophila simulans]